MIDVKISQVHKQEFKNLQESKLILLFKGKSVNEVLVNTLRRLSMDYVPTYAFYPDNITIEKNTSILNNDRMKLKLSQITIPDILVKPYFLEDKYWVDIDFRDPNQEKHPQDKKLLEIYINVTNDSKDSTYVLPVTTEHVKIYEDGVELTKFDPKFPHLFVKLRQNETFSCRCVGSLSIGLVHNIFAAAGTSYYDDITETEYKLSIESQGQMDEYEILHKSCRIMKDKLNITKKIVKNKYEQHQLTGNSITFEFENEDHTLCNIINDYLQNHKDVAFSGLSKPSLLIDTMRISLSTIKNDPVKIFDEIIDHIIKLFDEIESQTEKLGNKYIKYIK